jgi:hypothetical protein
MKCKNYLFVLIFFMPILLLAQDFSLGIGGDFVPKVKSSGIRRGIGYHFDFTYIERQRVGFIASVGWYREALFSEGQSSTAGKKYAVQDFSGGDNFFLDGMYSLYWLELAPTVVLYRHIKHDIAFNLGVGVGFYFAKNAWTWDVKNDLYRTAVEDGICYYEDPLRPNFGYNIRTSFDFPMTRQSRVRLEGKYIIYRPSLDYKICVENPKSTIQDSRNFELDALFLSLAVIFNL